MRISCLVFGHLISDPCSHWRSAEAALQVGGRARIRHVVACFLGGHTYERVGPREQHQEYKCDDCGHPLLFRLESDPFGTKEKFRKRVRYLCNLFGHTVHPVTERHSLHEYACECGHTFLKESRNASRITHPLICLFTGHLVTQISRRNDLVELLCQHCGHTFLVECENG